MKTEIAKELSFIVNDPRFMISFTDYLEDRIETLHLVMERTDEPREIAILQGQIRELRRMKQIKEEVQRDRK